jgi:hypothetical protein
MKYPFKYPIHLLVIVPMIPCFVALTIVMPHDALRWPIILLLWGTFSCATVDIILDTYVPEKE